MVLDSVDFATIETHLPSKSDKIAEMEKEKNIDKT